MYWTDYGTLDKIERASMDGTSRTVLHSTGLSTPYGLTLDYNTQTLYWIDYTLNKLESSRTDGSNRILLTRVNVQCPYGITFFDQKLYWGDWCQHKIYSTFLTSPNSVSSVISTGSAPYRIQVISEERQPIIRRLIIKGEISSNPDYVGANPCETNNGNCSFLCLLANGTDSSIHRYSCACPDHLMLDDNQKDCISKSLCTILFEIACYLRILHAYPFLQFLHLYYSLTIYISDV